MEKFLVEGGRRLRGEVRPHGAKNSVLPILAASLLCEGEVILHNCPDLTDVWDTLRILQRLGGKAAFREHTAVLHTEGCTGTKIPEDLMRRMRSSIVFLSALAARNGRAEITYPGGCVLGARPIDLHLKALKNMGLQVEERGGSLVCACPGGLRGAQIALDFPSVGATENIMIAAVKARGKTVIVNAAREPEITDLAAFLRKCGASVNGAGESVIEIEGVKKLRGCTYTVMPDRIEAATYLTAAAFGGELILEDIAPELLYPVIAALKECGCTFTLYGDWIHMCGAKRPERIGCVRTMPYPGFPTDAQAILMALCTVAKGTSVIIENIFENRFRHAAELRRMGARIQTEGRVAVIEGVEGLSGAPVSATDLRGGAALLLAAVMADGISEIGDIHHIDRGYEEIETQLSSLGARIKRIKEGT